MLVLLLLGLLLALQHSNAASVPLTPSTLYCSTNTFAAPSETGVFITKAFSPEFTYRYNPACDSSITMTKTAQFILFTPSFTANYTVQVDFISSNTDLVLEVQRGRACGSTMSTVMGCDYDSLGNSTTGFDEMLLVNGTTYAILLAPFSGTNQVNGGVLKIGACLNGYCKENQAPLSFFQQLVDDQVGLIVTPVILFLVGLVAVLLVCHRTVNGVVGCEGVDVEKLVALRKLLVANWIACMVVLFSVWAAQWGHASYAFTCIILLASVYIYVCLGAAGLAETRLVQHARIVKFVCWAFAAISFIWAIVVIAYAGDMASVLGPICEDDAACHQYFGTYVAFGVIAMFGLLALAIVTAVVGKRLDDIAIGMKAVAGGGKITASSKV